MLWLQPLFIWSSLYNSCMDFQVWLMSNFVGIKAIMINDAKTQWDIYQWVAVDIFVHWLNISGLGNKSNKFRIICWSFFSSNSTIVKDVSDQYKDRYIQALLRNNYCCLNTVFYYFVICFNGIVTCLSERLYVFCMIWYLWEISYPAAIQHWGQF